MEQQNLVLTKEALSPLPQKPIDPIERVLFSVDILPTIFKHLTTNDRTQARLVCKTWNNFLMDEGLDLIVDNCCISYSCVPWRTFARLNRRFRHISFGTVTTPKIANVKTFCTRFGQYTTSVAFNAAPLHELKYSLHLFPMLRKIIVYNIRVLPKLNIPNTVKHVHIRGVVSVLKIKRVARTMRIKIITADEIIVDDESFVSNILMPHTIYFFEAMRRACKITNNLNILGQEKLDVRHVRAVEATNFPEISYNEYNNLEELAFETWWHCYNFHVKLTTLRKLSTYLFSTGNPVSCDLCRECIVNSFANLSQIESFSSSAFQEWVPLGINLTKLEELYIQMEHLPIPIASFPPNMPNLRVLHIGVRGQPKLSPTIKCLDVDIPYMAANYPNLTEISIWHVFFDTKQVEDIGNSLKNIKSFHVHIGDRCMLLKWPEMFKRSFPNLRYLTTLDLFVMQNRRFQMKMFEMIPTLRTVDDYDYSDFCLEEAVKFT